MELRNILGNDYEVWLYENHRELGESAWRDIAIHILQSDGMIVINTSGSSESTGQKRECGIALNNNKTLYLLKHDTAEPLPELSWANYCQFSDSNFRNEFREFRDKLTWLIGSAGDLEKSRKIGTPLAIRQRQQILNGLRGNRMGLDKDGIQQYTKIIVDNYKAGTIVPEVATINLHVPSSESELKGFSRINLYQMIEKREFLDRSIIWDFFFAEVGRTIESGERKYLCEQILKQGCFSDAIFKRSKGNFEVIVEETERLTKKGFRPSVLLAPVDLMSGFLMFFSNSMDWSTGKEILKLDNDIKLRLVWPNIYVPLDDFILTNNTSGHFYVIPELGTKNKLAIAIGESLRNVDKVAFFVDLIVKYDLVEKKALSIIHVGD